MRTVLLLLVMCLGAPASAQPLLSPCTIPEVDGEAHCGTYRVFEDRAARRGRTVDLNIVVLRALGPERRPDPLFVLQGGPGQGVAQLADFYGRLFAEVRRARDIVLVDLRGTGKSNLLSCPQLGLPDAAGQFDDNLLAPGAVAACRESLEQRADLTKYTTALAMGDLDEVRGALGYERINLYGTSYGTYAAQTYMRDFPGRVRTVAMKGVVPHGQLAPLFHARDGETAWKELVQRCAADTRCIAAYPRLDEDLRAIVARLTRQPETLTVKQSSAPTVTITLSAGLFGEVLRNMLYTPENAARVPSVIRQVAAGDFSTVAPLAVRTRNGLSSVEISAGFFLSVICGEGMPSVSPAAIAANTRDTFAGDYRLRQQLRACDRWPRASDSAPRGAAITSSIPVLMLSGEMDPVTPPRRAEELLAQLPKGTHVVVANNGHPFGKLEGCGNLLIAKFIEAGSMQGGETACAAALPSVPFVYF